MPEAWGSNVGEGNQRLGRQLEATGDEIFQRAIQLQAMANDAAAKEAEAQWIEQSSDLHVEFKSLKGQAAVDARPAHIEKLRELRERIRDSLPNDMARKIYDGTTRQSFARSAFSAAEYAATQLDQYRKTADKATLEAYRNKVDRLPDDPSVIEEAIAASDSVINGLGRLDGLPEQEIENKKAGFRSELWRTKIEALARKDPEAASELLSHARERGEIQGSDYQKTLVTVQAQLRTRGAKMITAAVSEGWAPYMKPEYITRAAGVETALIDVVKEAQRANPDLEFIIGHEGGRRSQETQDRLVAEGKSQTRNSQHLAGRAVDLLPLKDGKVAGRDGELVKRVERAMYEAAERLGVKLSDKRIPWDLGHFELAKDFDTASYESPRKAEPVEEQEARAREYAQKTSGADPLYPEYVSSAVVAKHRRDKALEVMKNNTNRIKLDEYIYGIATDGVKPRDLDELRAMGGEAISGILDSMDATQLRGVMAKLAKNDKEQLVADSKLEYVNLVGLAETDPLKFVNTDLGEYRLTDEDRKKLLLLQQKKLKNAEQSPRTAWALQQLMPMLSAAGIKNSGSETKKKQFQMFNGALHVAIEEWQDIHGKAPTAKEIINEIGPRLLHEVSVPGTIFGDIWPSKVRTFNLPVPKEFKKKLEEAAAAEGMPINDTLIQRAYLRQLYREMWGGKKEGQGDGLSKASQ
jgi:peptidoglycan L-alanyl-D-glutamate endopeptidase CwlK